MDFEKLTDRARGFLQAAQTIAVREHHQRIAPAHLLKALLDDEQGMAAGLIEAAGGDAKTARREVDQLVAKFGVVYLFQSQAQPCQRRLQIVRDRSRYLRAFLDIAAYACLHRVECGRSVTYFGRSSFDERRSVDVTAKLGRRLG